jgi:hypothetical protein
MATVFAYSPDTGDGTYTALATPAATLSAGGFVATGLILDAVSPNGQPIPVDPATQLRPEVWVRNGPGDVNALGLGSQLTIKEMLENSIARFPPGSAVRTWFWTAAQIQSWYLAHAAATVFAVYQP